VESKSDRESESDDEPVDEGETRGSDADGVRCFGRWEDKAFWCKRWAEQKRRWFPGPFHLCENHWEQYGHCQSTLAFEWPADVHDLQMALHFLRTFSDWRVHPMSNN